MKPDTQSGIRALNDAFRQSFEGGHVALSAAVADLPAAAIAEIIKAVRAFDRFDADNDPHGEHDFGSLDVDGERVSWKIDDYDRSLRWHSPAANNPGVDLRDDIARAKDLVAASYMACHALDRGSGERSALCEVSNIAREKLEAVLVRLDQ